MIIRIPTFIALLVLFMPVLAEAQTNESFTGNGEIYISSIPEGAFVFLNDSLAGTTPLVIRGADKFDKRLKVVKEGFKDWEINLVLHGNKPNDIVAILDDKYGIASISSDPVNASVFIDDNLIGTTPLKPLRLERRNYNLRIEKEGYATWKEVLRLRPYVVSISPILESRLSFFEFNFNLKDTEILLDGNPVPFSVNKYDSVSTGMHNIEIKIPATGKTLTEEINFQADKFYSILKAENNLKPFLYSAFIPGAGQFVNGSYLKGFAIFAGTVGSSIFMTTSISNYNSKKVSLDNALQQYMYSGNETQSLYYRDLVEQRLSDANKALTYKRIAIGAFAAVYLYNLLDILFFESRDYIKINITDTTNKQFGVINPSGNYRLEFSYTLK